MHYVLLFVVVEGVPLFPPDIAAYKHILRTHATLIHTHTHARTHTHTFRVRHSCTTNQPPSSGEMGLKLAGATYDEVHAAGGGINASVHATRDASVGELVAAASRRLDRMLAAGTTHVEIKSG